MTPLNKKIPLIILLSCMLLTIFCGNDEKKWEEATEAAQKAMSCRIRFWDGILSQINST